MAPAEVAAFLARKRFAVVGFRAADGAPDGEPAAFFYAGGSISFEVPRDGRAHRSLLRDPRVVCSLEEFPSYAEIKGVSVHGKAVPAGVTGERVTFRIDEPRIESFDFSKMQRPPGAR
jgi:nitroimidazol reductase NimA-like FMN-containing flavoprotein (pyridoxamine 5'-phosphate oxidase superfamily)